MAESTNGDPAASGDEFPRREFFSYSSLAMAGGLAAGYGTLAAFGVRYLYLYPAGTQTKAWLFVATLDGMQKGASLKFETPTGAKIVVARRADNGTADDFVALSSVCPHLGCRVHWEPQNHRFFCPCHNGAFDPEGKATTGPPAEAGQSLAQYPLMVNDGMLFIEVPVVGLGSPEEA